MQGEATALQVPAPPRLGPPPPSSPTLHFGSVSTPPLCETTRGTKEPWEY